MGIKINELPATPGINKEDVLIVEDGQGTKKGTVQQLDEALGVSQLKEDLVNRTASKIATKSSIELQVEKLGNVVSPSLTFNEEIGTSISLSVEVGQTIFVTGKSYTTTYPLYMLFNGNTFVSKFSPHVDNKYYSSEKVTIPFGVNRIIVNGEKDGYAYPRIYGSITKDLAEVESERTETENILSNRINDLDTFKFSYIENSYVENGVIIEKSGFRRTDYINCE